MTNLSADRRLENRSGLIDLQREVAFGGEGIIYEQHLAPRAVRKAGCERPVRPQPACDKPAPVDRPDQSQRACDGAPILHIAVPRSAAACSAWAGRMVM